MKRIITPFTALLMVIISSGFGGGALAQTITGRISGTVLDANGSAIVGATVKVTNEDTNQTRTTMTDPNGFYVVTNLQVGIYSVSVEHQGLQFQADFFNAFNQVLLNNPNTNVSSGDYGRINSTAPGRNVQIGLRLTF